MPTLDIPRAEFPGEVEVAEGTDFQAKDPTGSSVNFTVIEVADDSVKVRLNHPLAGKDIHFKVKILEVSEADPE
jgi:FKBP-type peptidyl-prolyl cis-trans isomerase SlyD